jgi:phenylacetate-CoA ligase
MVWPPITLGADAVLAALVAQLEVTQWLSPDAIAQMQGRQLAILAAHHRAHTPAFAARLKAAGLTGQRFDTIESLKRLAPIMRRDAQAAGARFFALKTPDNHGPVNQIETSGSTGEPVRVRKTQLQGLIWDALMMRDVLWHDYDFSGRISTVRPQVKAFYESDGWGRPIDSLYVSGRSQGIPIGTDVREQLRLMTRFKPDVLSVQPTNLRAMADIWAAEGFALKSVSRIRTVGETVSAELREQVLGLTGIAIEDHYSAQETGSLAIQCPQSGLYHIASESVIVEVLDDQGKSCAEGETGRVMVTDLHNFATPLIRYGIGDHAEVGGACPCGRGLPTLRRILGRDRNLVLLPDGRRHWPLLGEMGRTFNTVAPARQYQVIQHSRTAVEMRVVTDTPLTADDQAAMTRILRDTLKHSFEVRIVSVEGPLPPGANGKFEDFLCLVTPDDGA